MANHLLRDPPSRKEEVEEEEEEEEDELEEEEDGEEPREEHVEAIETTSAVEAATDPESEQVQTKITIPVETEVKDTEMAYYSNPIRTNMANIETTIGESESTIASPADTISKVNSTATHSASFSPNSTAPDLHTTPGALQPTLPSSRPVSPTVNMAIQMASYAAPPAPPADVPMPSFFNELGSEIITLYVGSKRKEFPIHGNLLRLKSTFFKNFSFATDDTGKAGYYLPDASAEAVGLIINWLYRQGVDLIPASLSAGAAAGPMVKNTAEHEAFTQAVTRSIEVYLLSEEFRIDKLMDLVMTKLGQAYQRFQTFPSPADIAAVYKPSSLVSSTSPPIITRFSSRHAPRLRKYMARSYQALANLEDGDIESTGWTTEEVDEVVSAVPRLFKDFRTLNRESWGVEPRAPGLDLVCEYHVHGPRENCLSSRVDFRGAKAKKG